MTVEHNSLCLIVMKIQILFYFTKNKVYGLDRLSPKSQFNQKHKTQEMNFISKNDVLL